MKGIFCELNSASVSEIDVSSELDDAGRVIITSDVCIYALTLTTDSCESLIENILIRDV